MAGHKGQPREATIVGAAVFLVMLAAVALGLIWSLGHRAYRELIRRRQVARVRRVLDGDLAAYTRAGWFESIKRSVLGHGQLEP
jgi:hypothetical protein